MWDTTEYQVLQRGALLQKISLVSGLILFLFAALHFSNHALGLISLDTMVTFQEWRLLITRSIPGTIVLLAALMFHMGHGLYKLAGRSTFRLPAWEIAQIGLGLLIPFLLLPHIVNTRIANQFFGVQDTYLYELARLWPSSALLQTSLLAIVWLHGCIGIHHWLRLSPTYTAAQPVLLFIAIAIPLGALGGFMVAGRVVASTLQDPAILERIKQATAWPDAVASEKLANYRVLVRLLFGALLVAVAGVIAWKQYLRRAVQKVTIRYIGGPTVNIAPGATLLEISRMRQVPHASVCGGRARCSTCRVRIEEGADKLPPPVFPETLTLASISAPSNIRLACQIRPSHSLTVTRLLRAATTGPDAAFLEETDSAGVEKPLAVLFLDLRDFTKLSSGRLPYDVVYMLNEFFASTGTVITANGGWIDKVMGDGMLAVFGQKLGVEAGCRQALRAARDIDLALDHVNAKLESEIGRPLKIGIGIHAGPLLVGRIGYGESVGVTVVGTVVNVASRLEGVAKEKGYQIVLSRDVARFAGWIDSELEVTKIKVRGMESPMEVIGIGRGRDLPTRLLSPIEGEIEGERASSNRMGA